MLERKVEARLKRKIESMGGLAVKFTSPGMAGVPDRLLLLPDGRAVFAEVKAPGKTLRPLQLKRKAQLEALGFSVYVVDSYPEVDALVQEVGL